MRFSQLYSIAALVARVLAQNATELAKTCPSFLSLNSTNVASLLPCTLLNYSCEDAAGRTPGDGSNRIIWNATASGPPPANCTPLSWQIQVDHSINGSLSIPNLTDIGRVIFEGDELRGTLLNLTSVEMNDLVTIDGDFYFDLADKMVSLSVPKLRSVRDLEFHLTGENPPSTNLSFPSLVSAERGILLAGNIDFVDLPVLNNTVQINITSTGKLDCIALAKSVVNHTIALVPDAMNTNNTVICNSPQGSITTYRAATPTNSSERNFCLRGDSMILVVLFAFLVIALS